MKNKGSREETKVDEKIKGIFLENMKEVTMHKALKEKLISAKEDLRQPSFLEKFLEKEICIPMSSVSAAAGIMIIATGVLINTLLLPGEVPEPNYQIIEMQASQSQPYQEGLSRNNFNS